MPTKRKDRGKILHTPTEYGKSVNGSPLEIFLPKEITNPKILILAGIHGDEPESTTLLSEALRHLKSDELNNAVILCANPDGMARGTRANVNGVDLNRNFPALNWKPEPVYYRNSKDKKRDIELSPGVKYASEPETKLLIDIIEKLDPNYIVSIHAPLACIEDPKKTGLSKWISDNTELPIVQDIGYKTPGSMGSWAADKDIPIITFELPSESIEEMKKTIVPTLIDVLTANCKY
jgi:protein MpaA